jgi:hypothetical protein
LNHFFHIFAFLETRLLPRQRFSEMVSPKIIRDAKVTALKRIHAMCSAKPRRRSLKMIFGDKFKTFFLAQNQIRHPRVTQLHPSPLPGGEFNAFLVKSYFLKITKTFS